MRKYWKWLGLGAALAAVVLRVLGYPGEARVVEAAGELAEAKAVAGPDPYADETDRVLARLAADVTPLDAE